MYTRKPILYARMKRSVLNVWQGGRRYFPQPAPYKQRNIARNRQQRDNDMLPTYDLSFLPENKSSQWSYQVGMTGVVCRTLL